MARRYIGEATIYITYHDAGDYRGSIVVDGHRWPFDRLWPAPIGFGPGVAYDSPTAYDKMAQEAVSFGSYYSTYNRGDDMPDWAPTAEFADALEAAACGCMDDQGEYHVYRRKPQQ